MSEIAMGPDKALYFTNYSNFIGRMTTGGTISIFSDQNPSSSLILNVALGPDKRLWFADYYGHVGTMTPAGGYTMYSTSASASTGTHAQWITAGPDGAMWFLSLQGSSSVIYRITTSGHVTNSYAIPTANAQPDQMAAGPDGSLWFTENGANKIGRLQ